ncbi:restriction endonuclease subunit S [Marinobacter salsuginis]
MSFPAYPEYKDTEIAWIATIPSSWKLLPFFSRFFERKESNKGMKNENLLSLSYGRIVRKDIATLEGLLPASFETYQVVHPGDIVFRLTDLQNDKRSLRSAIVHEKGIITSAYLAVSAKDFNPSFSNYLFRAYDLMKVFYSMGGGLRQSMKYDDMKWLQIACPSIDEQTQIARFLDHETAKIDALIREQERLIELLQEKRQAVISHAVTKGLDPDVPMKDSGVEWLGEVPAHWEAARVKHVATFITSGPRGWSDFITEVSGDVFLQSGDLDDNLGLKLATAKMVKPPAGAEGMRTKLKSGDVVVCITGANTGRVAVVEDLQRTTFINQHLSLIRTDVSQIDPRYLALSLSSLPGRSYFDVVQYGLKEGLSLSNVSEAPIALPSVEEQELIVKTLNKLISKFNALSKATSEEIALLQERRSALISAAVTGKIDVRNWQTPTEESAFGEKVRKAGVEATA